MPHLQWRKGLVKFFAVEGAGGHCEETARSLFHQGAYDWLDEMMPYLHHSRMIRPRIPISRAADGLWKAAVSSVELRPDRRIPIPATAPEETLADLIETAMGEALLSLDKNGRGGNSEAIQREIVVEHVPYYYRCIEPMQLSSQPSPIQPDMGSLEWRCVSCGTGRTSVSVLWPMRC